METKKSNAGRPPIDPTTKKKNRAVSLTDTEYERLKLLAKEAKTAGVSAFLVKHHKLDQ